MLKHAYNYALTLVNEGKVRAYIMDSFTLEGYEGQNLPENPVIACHEIFLREYGWRIGQNRMTERDAFTEWLQGLPSAISVAFYYAEERDLLEKWLVKPAAENEIDDDMWVDSIYRAAITAVFYKMYRETEN